MQTTEQIELIAAALAKAQGAYLPLAKDREATVPFKRADGSSGQYKFKYATLDACFDATRKALSDNGICVIQPPTNSENGIVVTTRLIHESGQWIEESLDFLTASSKPQDLGSLITYAKRYLLCGLLGITADEDDDGNAASGNQGAEITPQKSAKPPAKANGKPAAKPTAAQMNKESAEYFGEREYVTSWKSSLVKATTADLIAAARNKLHEIADAGKVSAEECATLAAAITRQEQKNAEVEANQDLQTTAAT